MKRVGTESVIPQADDSSAAASTVLVTGERQPPSGVKAEDQFESGRAGKLFSAERGPSTSGTTVARKEPPPLKERKLSQDAIREAFDWADQTLQQQKNDYEAHVSAWEQAFDATNDQNAFDRHQLQIKKKQRDKEDAVAIAAPWHRPVAVSNVALSPMHHFGAPTAGSPAARPLSSPLQFPLWSWGSRTDDTWLQQQHVDANNASSSSAYFGAEQNAVDEANRLRGQQDHQTNSAATEQKSAFDTQLQRTMDQNSYQLQQERRQEDQRLEERRRYENKS